MSLYNCILIKPTARLTVGPLLHKSGKLSALLCTAVVSWYAWILEIDMFLVFHLFHIQLQLQEPSWTWRAWESRLPQQNRSKASTCKASSWGVGCSTNVTTFPLQAFEDKSELGIPGWLLGLWMRTRLWLNQRIVQQHIGCFDVSGWEKHSWMGTGPPRSVCPAFTVAGLLRTFKKTNWWSRFGIGLTVYFRPTCSLRPCFSTRDILFARLCRWTVRRSARQLILASDGRWLSIWGK